MISGLIKAFNQTPDPTFRKVATRALGWSFLLFSLLMIIVWWVLDATQFFGIGWLEGIVDALGWVASLIIAALLFPAAALTIITFLLDDIANAVEAKHYPNLPAARDQRLSETTLTGLRFAAIAIAVNLVALPVYLLLLFIPPLNIFVFATVNGYLLGREYFELVAFRRVSPAEARQMWKRHRTRLFFAGAIIASLLSIPFVNWFMPVIAAAYMVHIFEGLRQKQAS